MTTKIGEAALVGVVSVEDGGFDQATGTRPTSDTTCAAKNARKLPTAETRRCRAPRLAREAQGLTRCQACGVRHRLRWPRRQR